MRRDTRPTYGRTCFEERTSCARDGTEKDFGDGVEDGLNSALGYSGTQLMQPIELPIPDSLPVGVALRFVLEIQVFEVLGEFEDHVLTLLEIDFESMFDGVGDPVEDTSGSVKFFVGLNDLKSFIAVLDNFHGRYVIAFRGIERFDDLRGYNSREVVVARHVERFHSNVTVAARGEFRCRDNRCTGDLVCSRLVQH